MSELFHTKIGFIGFGHMASLLCEAMLQSKMIKKSQVLFLRKNKKKQKETSHKYGITAASIKAIVQECSLCFICVRPKDVKEILKEIPKDDLSSTLFVSIASGVPISFFEKELGEKTPILRVMPNTPSEIGEGMNLFAFSTSVPSSLKTQVRLLFTATGHVEEVPESAIDTLTAISGSGPAYVLKLIHIFEKKAEQSGIPKEQARKIAAQTFKGTASLLLRKKGLEELLQGIAIPGGTTEAGLQVFAKSTIEPDLIKVFDACIQKAEAYKKDFS